MAYGRTYARRTAGPAGPRPNKYDAGCSTCGRKVPAGTGILTGNRGTGYEVRHGERKWIGSPVSGRWAGGCEEYASQPVYEVTRAPARRSVRGWDSRGRCEDAPCCGCCD